MATAGGGGNVVRMHAVALDDTERINSLAMAACSNGESEPNREPRIRSSFIEYLLLLLFFIYKKSKYEHQKKKKVFQQPTKTNNNQQTTNNKQQFIIIIILKNT